MPVNDQQQHLLKKLPGVDRLLEAIQDDAFVKQCPKSIVLRAIRETLDGLRQQILSAPTDCTAQHLSEPYLLGAITQKAMTLNAFSLQRVINATGVVIHTNLGRSRLAREAIDHVALIAGCYSNLEYDLQKGRRGSRYAAVKSLICEISGAEAAMVVNNNAGAVLLCLDTLARGKEVVVSRGELVEIGGSFRIPDVMAKSGAILKEVGTTNRTHLKDYQTAINDNSAMLLKVHTSNYSIVGFTASVPLADLAPLGAAFGLTVMEDLGSGSFIDLSKYGIDAEPTVQMSVATGADVITFSGDKLLGGPQAGLIVGKKPIIDQIKANPLTRALRIDKLTLAALEATLRLYRDERRALSRIPTLSTLTAPLSDTQRRATQIADGLKALNCKALTLSLIERPSKAGGGSLPRLELVSCCVGIHIRGYAPNRIESALRAYSPPILGRIENDTFIIDPRTMLESDLSIVVDAIGHLLREKNERET